MTYNTFNALDYVRQEVANKVQALRHMTGDPTPEMYLRSVRRADVKSIYPADWQWGWNSPEKIREVFVCPT